MSLIHKTNFTECFPIADAKVAQLVPMSDQTKVYDRSQQYFNSTIYKRGMFDKAPYDFAETYRIIDTESFVSSTFRKKRTLILKDGFQLVSENADDVEYIKKRLEEFQYVTNKSFKDLLEEIVTSLIHNHNVFLLPVRKLKSSTGNVRKILGKKVQPIAGIYVLPETKISLVEDEYGQVIGYKYQVNKGLIRYFDADEVLHLKLEAKPGFNLGTPPLEPLVDDIIALRQIEESLERLIYKLSVPIIHAKVGTDEKPAGIDRLTGEKEVDQVNQALLHMEDAGGITTSERVEFKILGAESQALRLSGYLEYFKNRVLVGLSISDLDFGVANSTSSGSAEIVTKALQQNVEMYQRKLEDFVTDVLFTQILLESDKYLGQLYLEEADKVIFKVIPSNVDEKIKIESHLINEANAYLITPDEYRTLTGKRPLTAKEKEELDRLSGRKAEEEQLALAEKTADANIAAQKEATKLAKATAASSPTPTAKTTTTKKVDPSKTTNTNQHTDKAVKKASTGSANKSVQKSKSTSSPIKDALNLDRYVTHTYNNRPELASTLLSNSLVTMLHENEIICDAKSVDEFSHKLTSSLQNYIIGTATRNSTLDIVEKLLCKKILEIINENGQ